MEFYETMRRVRVEMKNMKRNKNSSFQDMVKND